MSGDSAVTAMDTAETKEKTHTSDKVDSKELQILAAMRSRVTYFRDKADSVTIESVRRLLEEDMGLEKYALDVHKRFIKEHLVQCIEDAGNDDISENERKDDVTPVEEVAKLSEEHEAKNDVRDKVGDDEKDEGNKEALMSDIRRALRKRSSYIKANSEEITMASLRRLLEEDLELEKHSLDAYKKFINEELDDVLEIHDAPKHSTESTRKNVKTKVKSTPSKKVDSEENSDLDAEGDVEDEEVSVKKTIARKRKSSKSEMTGKRKCENGKSLSGKKKAKHAETDSENDSDAGDSEMIAKKPLKQTKETATATAVYRKRVEHLKSVIKSCGMSVPPSVYRKAKQAPEEKREATLIEELEQILSKEGLSSDPSEKEIKDVKKRKTISKELEGIDTSNIVSSSRRRSTTSFAPPPKPKITVESESESESDEPEESENEEDNKEEDEGNEEAEEGSQSEEESNNDDDGGEESE